MPSCCFFLLSFNLPISINLLSGELDSSFGICSSSDKAFPGSFILLVQSQNSHSIVHWSRNRASFISRIKFALNIVPHRFFLLLLVQIKYLNYCYSRLLPDWTKWKIAD